MKKNNYILRLNKKFYRVSCSPLELAYLRRFCRDYGVSLMVYVSKHKGFEFFAFLRMVGLKFNQGRIVKVNFPQQGSVRDHSTVKTTTRITWALLCTVLVLAGIFIIGVTS